MPRNDQPPLLLHTSILRNIPPPPYLLDGQTEDGIIFPHAIGIALPSDVLLIPPLFSLPLIDQYPFPLPLSSPSGNLEGIDLSALLTGGVPFSPLPPPPSGKKFRPHFYLVFHLSPSPPFPSILRGSI